MSLLKRIEQVNALGDEAAAAPRPPAAPAPVRPLVQAASAPSPTSGLTGVMGGGSGAAPTTLLANPGGGTRNLDGIAALRRPVGGDLDQFTELRSRVQDKLIAEIGPNVDPSKTHEMRKKIQQLFDSILETEGTQLTRADRVRLFEQIVADILGFGPIQPLLDDESVSEVMVNGPKSIYVERKGKLIKTDVTFQNDDHVMRVIDRIISPLGRRCDESSPMVDARLPDGSRVNAIIPPLSLVGPVVTIRKFSRNPLTTDDLVNFGTLTPDMVAFLKACVEARLNVLVSGGTGSGKTTLLNVLSSFIPDDERIVTIEDSAELQLRQDHVVTLESRPANVEGKGRVAIRELVINALRMRPERIVVGECRGAEALDMLQAMNTGHDGSMTTAHA
ncbi:MAG: CpaF family protein, partial [Chloroflexi bacterium]|nr:CpaF family protein [Chloroflexota bacterium]